MPKKNRNTGNPPGPPPMEPTREMLDDAKYLLGRTYYPSKAADRLGEMHGISRPIAYRVLDRARAEVIDSLKASGTAADPLTAVYLVYANVMADPKSSRPERIAAANGVVKLLGLDRYLKALDSLGAEDLLAAILARQAARAAPPPAQ